MDAFDMISEPILVGQELREHSSRVGQSVELIQSLANALLAEDYEKIRALHEQMSGIRDGVDRVRLALYSQIKEMHFHAAGGDTFSQYVAYQDKLVDSSQGFADLLVLRRTTIPIELRDDFQALVTEVVKVGRQIMSLAEGLFCEAQTVCTETEAQNPLGAIQGIIDDRDQARRREMEFARHLYSLEKQLDPVTVMFLDKYRAALHEVAHNAERAAGHLCLMIH